MSYINLAEEPVSNSKFYMLRCVIAMAHADGHVCDEERAYINGMLKRINLNDEQCRTLKSDLNQAMDVADLLRHINDPRYRGQVLYFARIMAFKDGELCPNEDSLLKRLHLAVTDGLDMDGIREDAVQAASLELALHDIDIDKTRPEGGLFGLFDSLLLSLGIDLMKE